MKFPVSGFRCAPSWLNHVFNACHPQQCGHHQWILRFFFHISPSTRPEFQAHVVSNAPVGDLLPSAAQDLAGSTDFP